MYKLYYTTRAYKSQSKIFETTKSMARGLGLEPRTTQSKCVVLPLHHPRTKNLAPQRGIEPRTT
jgi:hypothetical protein